MDKLVSVIIPMYNVEKFVEWCLASIEEQTYEYIEIICIDDGSTDETYSVASAWKEKSRYKFVVYKIKNSGVSVARNIGVSYATGEYICFVDADDMLSSEYIGTLVQTLEKRRLCGAAICGKKNIDEYENRSFAYKRAYTELEIEYFDSYSIMEKMLYHKLVAGIWNLMIRRKILEKNELKFAEGYAYSEDLQFVWKTIACCNEVAVISAPLYLYRIRSSSAMRKFDIRRKDGLYLFKQLEIFMTEKRPEFSKQFEKYGVAYWIWSTMWQAVNLSDTYKQFCDKTDEYSPKLYIQRLLDYPNIKVRVTSILFLISKKVYYYSMKIYLKGIRGRWDR